MNLIMLCFLPYVMRMCYWTICIAWPSSHYRRFFQLFWDGHMLVLLDNPPGQNDDDDPEQDEEDRRKDITLCEPTPTKQGIDESMAGLSAATLP